MEAECAEEGTEECSAYVAAKLVFFNEWKTVASGPGRATCCLELVGKKGDEGDGRLSGKMCRYKSVDIEALERLMESEEAEVWPRYIFKYATRRGSNIFQLFDTKEKERTTSWQAEGVDWSTKERG